MFNGVTNSHLQQQQPIKQNAIAPDNSGMAMPMMPQMQVSQQQIEQYMFNMNGRERLQQIPCFHVKPVEQDVCGDLSFCSPDTTKLVLKPNQFSAADIMEIQFDKADCFQEYLEGEFIASSQDGKTKEKLYDVGHKRTCFACKCCFLGLHPIGMINWLICNKVNPSVSELKKDGKVINRITYSVCSGSASIMDGDGNFQYLVGNPETCCDTIRDLRDKNNDPVQGFIFNAYYGGHKNSVRIAADLIFPPTMSEDDRAAIILSMIRLN